MQTKKHATGVTLSAVTVKDLDKMKHLFVDLLGLEIKDYAEEYGWMELAGEHGALLGVCKHTDHSADAGVQQLPGSNAWVSISVDDIEFTKKHLEDNGIQFLSDIIEVPGHVKMALFADYDGNNFWICQKLD